MPYPYYAVSSGRRPGVYQSWPECQSQVNQFRGAKYKGFQSYEDAQAFVDQGQGAASNSAYQAPTYETRRNDSSYNRGGYQASGGNNYQAAPTQRQGYQSGPTQRQGNGGGGNLAGNNANSTPSYASIGVMILQPQAEREAAGGASSRFINPQLLYTLKFDGASRGNPGLASAGAVITQSNTGTQIGTISQPVGRQTNNYAEYCAILFGLRAAAKIGIRRITVQGDSDLVVKQVQGIYKVNSPNIAELAQAVRKASTGFESFSISHIRRNLNSEADALANQGLDSGGWQGLQTSEGLIDFDTSIPMPNQLNFATKRERPGDSGSQHWRANKRYRPD